MLKSLLAFVLLTLCGGLVGQQDAGAAAPTLDRQRAASELVEARAKIAALPKDPVAGSPEAAAQQVWQRRVELLTDALALLARDEARQKNAAELAKRRQDQLASQAQLAALPPAAAPGTPSEPGFSVLETQVAAQRDRVAALRAEEAQRAQSVESIPSQLAQARTRLQAALDRGIALARDADAATDPTQKDIIQVRVGNAALDAEVARLVPHVLEAERELEGNLAPLRADERSLAARRLERMEQEYELYRQSLAQAMDRAGVRLEQELQRRESAVQAAQDPAARFLAGKNLDIVRFEVNEAEHGRALLALRGDLEEQARRLSDEVGELKSLRGFLDNAGAGQQTGERIKFTMQRVKLRRQALDRTLRRDVAGELRGFRSRRFELEDRIFFLKELWKQDVDATARQLNVSDAAAFRVAAQGLFEPYGAALSKERDSLTAVIGAGQEFQVALFERSKALDALEVLIRSKVFWIRGADPIGPDLWPRAVAEARVVDAWARGVGSEEGATRVSERLTRPGVLALLVLVLVGLPILLFWLRQRLRRFVRRMNDLTVGDDAGIRHRLLAVSGGILSVALLPVFVFVLGRSIDADWLPATLVPVLGDLLEHLAVFLLFWLLSRSFFAGRGTAQVQFGMGRDAAHALHRALGVLLTGYLIFGTAESVLSHPPFLLVALPLEVLPRLAHTLFLVTAVVAGILLLQPRSVFSREFAAGLGGGFAGRRWPILAGLVCLAGVVVVALEIAGFRYGAGVLARSLGLSLVALLVLVALYKGAVAATLAGMRSRRARPRWRSDAGSETEDAGPPLPSATTAGQAPVNPGEAGDVPAQEAQIRKLVRALFLIGGAVLIANLWGFDSQTFATLDQLKAYDIRDTGEVDEFVSYGDLLRTLLIVLGSYYLLKYLPGLYEFGIFSRLEVDSGLAYAILTMSRYGIFTVGAIVALAQLHLDLGRLGWLMAAMGVGLGFGLQEIVSNFVSGIILLVERPVRVGDVVTIGSTSGKVQRINIRATSVINFDRQEIIVPNRSLITQEVINWTRGDTIIRLVVPIGVAYGSDVDMVTKMLLEIAREQPEVLADPAPQAFFLAHGESSLDFELRVHVPDPATKVPLQHRLNREINRRLADLGIEIPFPQRDLHIRSSHVRWPAPELAEPTGDTQAK